MKEKDVKCPFMILNTDRSDKNRAHWRSTLDLHPKKDIFLFDSSVLNGLKNFIIQNKKNEQNFVWT